MMRRLAALIAAAVVLMTIPVSGAEREATADEGPLLGCWNAPFDPVGWRESICFEPSGVLRSSQSGIEEGFEFAGTFEVVGTALRLRGSEHHGEGWIFPAAELTCDFRITPEVRLDLVRCSPEAYEGHFDRVPPDPLLAWFPDRIAAGRAELAEALLGCWHHYGPVSIDITNLCFEPGGRLTTRTLRGNESEVLDGNEDALVEVKMIASYEVADGRLRIEGPGGEGWAFDLPAMDCAVVMVPESRFRMGRCEGGVDLLPMFQRDEAGP